MKRLLVLLIGILLSVSAFAQDTSKYPTYFVQNGDTLGIVISIEQAQKIDNDLELLELFKQMGISCDSTISSYVLVVNKYNQKVALLNVKISTLESLNSDQKAMIVNLNQQIENYKQDVADANQIILKKTQIISNDEKEITKLKIQKAFGYIGTGILFIATSILTVKVLTH